MSAPFAGRGARAGEGGPDADGGAARGRSRGQRAQRRAQRRARAQEGAEGGGHHEGEGRRAPSRHPPGAISIMYHSTLGHYPRVAGECASARERALRYAAAAIAMLWFIMGDLGRRHSIYSLGLDEFLDRFKEALLTAVDVETNAWKKAVKEAQERRLQRRDSLKVLFNNKDGILAHDPIAKEAHDKLNNITSFYGSSCANNGKDALNNPETLGQEARRKAKEERI
eukprot:1195286-Prorocentrum_minimum.AAC.3